MVILAKQTTHDDLVGRVIEDRYEVLLELGDNMLGRMYDARHVTLGRAVTIEVLGPRLASNEAARTCFLRHARQASRLRHQGIVEVEHQGVTPNASVYMATEPRRGITLEELLRRETKLTWARARGIALQIAAALKAAHRRSVVHQGLRPAVVHLWIEEDGSERVKVSGFGMAEVGARAQRRPEETDSFMRSLGIDRYMPPEQLTERCGSVKGDVYALGAVLHHMLTGEPPRPSHLQGTARQKEPMIPAAVEVSLVRALSVKASDRHDSVQELERELEEITADQVGRGPFAAELTEATTTGNGASKDEASKVAEPPLLASPTNVPLGPEDEGTMMFERPQIEPREESTTMFERLPARRDDPLLEATELFSLRPAFETSLPIRAKAAAHLPAFQPPPATFGHAPVSEPAALVTSAARPAAHEHPRSPATAPVSSPWVSEQGPAPGPATIARGAPPACEPMLGSPLPECPPPDRTWLVAIMAAVLVAAFGIAIGVVIANASEPRREAHDVQPPKTAGRNDHPRPSR